MIEKSNVTENNWSYLMRVPSYTVAQTGVSAMAIDSTIPPNTEPSYKYRVSAANVVGDDTVYAGSVGFPVIALNSTASAANVSQQIAPPGITSFGISPSTSGDAPFNVTFTGIAAGATGWSWDFGDGNFASDNGKQNPGHVFMIPGTYSVRLTSMNTGGNNTSASSTITVTRAPLPVTPSVSFTNTTPREGAAPFTVIFNADASTSSPAVWATWRWAFGDGTFSSVKNPAHAYQTAGSYTVSLTATNLGGSNVATHTGYINVTAAPPTNGTINAGVFRPSNGNWFLDTTKTGVVSMTFHFGTSGDTPIAGDWDGNVITDIGVFRPSNGNWFLDITKTGVVNKTFHFGTSGDIPVVGDWNNDGTTDVGVFRPSNGNWFLDITKTGVVNKTFHFGTAGDKPVVGEWM
jgi:PKD repeat protein